MSYLEERVYGEMKVPPEENVVRLRRTDVTGDTFYESPIFSTDEKDNIRILVYDIDRRTREYQRESTRKTQSFSDDMTDTYYVTRLNPKNVTEESGKYRFPKGGGIYPFFHPSLIEKFERKEKIKTLILTEGYFKSFAGCRAGLNVVGLSSITHYNDSTTKRLHRDIKRLIFECRVENIVVLHDGDCKNISMKDLEMQRELTRRPMNFVNALKGTLESLRNEVDMTVHIWWAHVNTDELTNELRAETGDSTIQGPKGLDDLLLDEHYNTAEIVSEIDSPSRKTNNYFHCDDLRGCHTRLTQYFCVNKAENFYGQWQEVIGNRQFVFNGSIYKWDETKEKLEISVPKELRNFIRVGDDYYEKLLLPSLTIDGQQEWQLVPRRKGTITDDFGRGAIEKITKYKAFVTIPSHDNYQQVVNNCYNKYFPLSHKPEQGPFPHIDSLVRHIFGEQYELGMDYLQLLYQRPQQILPILCLVSSERETGKTSFLDLMNVIFNHNSIVVGNNEITSDFNAMFGGKLIVGVDETSLDDNSKITERLKMLSTSKTITINGKGKDQVTLRNFSKFILCSNNETHFIYTDSEEVRFWVRKVPRFTEAERFRQDADHESILQWFEEEADAFLWYLNTRQMSVPQARTRMWFTPADIETESLRNLKAAQRPAAVKELDSYFSTHFLTFPARERVFTITSIKRLVPELRNISSDRLREFLRQYFKAKDYVNESGKAVVCRTKVPYDRDQNGIEVYDTDLGRGLTVRAEDVLLKEEYQDMLRMIEERNRR